MAVFYVFLSQDWNDSGQCMGEGQSVAQIQSGDIWNRQLNNTGSLFDCIEGGVDLGSGAPLSGCGGVGDVFVSLFVERDWSLSSVVY